MLLTVGRLVSVEGSLYVAGGAVTSSSKLGKI